MKNTVCIICGKEFAPRKGKLYCSNSCKQQGHLMNKEKKSDNSTVEIHPNNNIPKICRIDFSEFLEFLKLNPGVPIEQYAYVRKNLVGIFSLNDFMKYWENLDESAFFERLYIDSDPICESYKEFKKQYHDGLVEIYNS